MLKLELKHPAFTAQLNAIRRAVYTNKRRIDTQAIKSAEPIPFSQLDKSRFVTIKPNENWGNRFSCAWFKLCGNVDGMKNPVILIDIGKYAGEGLVYTADGEVHSAFSNVWTPVDVVPSGRSFREIPIEKDKKTFEFFADCGFNGFLMQDIALLSAKFRNAYIVEKHTDIFDYYYDFLTLFLLYTATDDRTQQREISLALKKSFAQFKQKNIVEAKNTLAILLAQPSVSSLELSAIGHGHLDLAWMWPIRETKRKAVRTLTNALANIQKYPDYIFGTSQPQQLLWLKQNHPTVYQKVKQAVADGRIEIQGGFWAECDTNLPSGESLIRQAIFGMQYLKEEFGQTPKMCWLPDAFGYNGNLPQILKGCGMDYFSTIKLSWNKVTRFPYRTFFWEGIDNSRVLVHMPPEGDYNSSASPKAMKKAEKNYTERELNTALLVYGAGDGGGGPSEPHLELLSRTQSLKGLPKVANRRAEEFFEQLSRLDIKQHHKGELYLETHQGTLTTQAKTKLFNRLCERLLHNAEFLATRMLCMGRAYPHEFFEKLWKEVLLYQFHDIIPGSSVTRVNVEAREGYQKIVDELANFVDEQLGNNSQNSQLCALNATSFSRKEIVKHNGEFFEAHAAPYSATKLVPLGEDHIKPTVTHNTLQNNLLKLTFNKRGEICSCLCHERELANGILHRLTVYSDVFTVPFNAWDIDINYTKKRKKHLAAKSSRTFVDGLDAVCENTYHYKKCRIVQRVVLPYNSDTVRFETEVDWHTKHKMLRADFFPTDFAPTAKFDIQFGHIERSTSNATDTQRAQFEVCAHKWTAVEGQEGGFAVLNDCKYGHRVKDNYISLNLLRAPTFPDKVADRGQHKFTYAFCPFEKGGIAKVVRQGYLLNNPLTVFDGQPYESFATCSDGVIVETIKAACEGDGIVIRLYETLGKSTNAWLKLCDNLTFDSVHLTNLREEGNQAVDLTNLSFSPFEIKTILLKGTKYNAN